MFPNGKLNGRVMKTELKSILNQLTLPVEDDEFEKLWLRWLLCRLVFHKLENCIDDEGMILKEEALFR